MFGRRFARRKSKELPKVNIEPMPTLPRLHMYESDEESIQASPILEKHDTFDDFDRFAAAHNVQAEPEGPVTGPVTGSAAPQLAMPAKAAAKPAASTINFTARPVAPRQASRSLQPAEVDQYDSDDDEALPFAATRQMATRGQTRNFLPEISTGPVMTKDHYETYRKSLNILQLGRQNSTISRQSDSEDEDGDIDTMQAERRRRKEIALARQQQEVHMSVHRQRVNKAATASSSGLAGEFMPTTTFDRVEDDDDMLDDVPLSVLKAHNFPRTMKTRESASPEVPQEPSALSAGATSGRAVSPGFQQRHSLHSFSAPGTPGGAPAPGRGLIGEIMRQEELKKAKYNSRYSMEPPAAQQLPPSQSYQSMQSFNNPMLAEIRSQVQQMSELQAHLMQMAQGDQMSRMGYSRAASIRSMPQTYHTPMMQQSQFQQSPTMTMHTMPTQHTAASSPYASQVPRVRAVRKEEAEDEDDDEAWRKFAERRQTLRAEWMAA